MGSRGRGPESADRPRVTSCRRRELMDARRAVDPSQYGGRRETHLRVTPQKADIQPVHRMRNMPPSPTGVHDRAEIMRSRAAQTSVDEIFDTPNSPIVGGTQ